MDNLHRIDCRSNPRDSIARELGLRAYESNLWLALLEAQRLELQEPIADLARLHVSAGKLRRQHDREGAE